MCLILRAYGAWRNVPNTGKTAASVEIFDILGSGLKTTSEQEDDGADENSVLAAESIGGETCEHGAKEGAASEDGDDSTTRTQKLDVARGCVCDDCCAHISLESSPTKATSMG